MARLVIDGVTKTFGTFTALDKVSIDVRDGEFLAVLGPSGCGKTTLLRAVAGFDPIDGGRIVIGDQEMSSPRRHVPPEERRVGIVFQSYALWPHMTVAENVGYALKVARVPAARRDRQVVDALEMVGLTGYGDRRPASLSGGQRQRVALARCLVMTPALVLLDEPLANLDVHLRAAMQDAFADLHKRTGTTMVYITHDQAEAMALADRIAVLDHGRVLQIATPGELFREPADAVVARFIGEGMVLPAEIGPSIGNGMCEARIYGVAVRLRCAGQPPSKMGQVCLRTRELRIATGDEPGIACTIERIVYQGGYFRVEAAIDAARGTSLDMEISEPAKVAVGDRVRVAVAGGWVIPIVQGGVP